MGYQSFPGEEKGASKTTEKLSSLRLPTKMDGKSFLDIGCNAGFFCFEAERRGASRIVGIDKNVEVLEKAKERAEELGSAVEFRDADWSQLPDQQFDVVLYSSALHYARSPINLFELIHSRLSRNGMLILECGVSLRDRSYGDMVRAVRAKGASKFYPSMDLLRRVWLRPFAVRLVGSSVKQSGDPIDRYVFHCRKFDTTVVFVTGDGNVGKTTLSLELDPDVLIRTDTFLSPRIDRRRKQLPPVDDLYRSKKSELGTSIKNTWNALRDQDEVREYFADEIFQAIRINRGAKVIMVEGYVLADLAELVATRLRKAGGFRIWDVGLSHGS